MPTMYAPPGVLQVNSVTNGTVYRTDQNNSIQAAPGDVGQLLTQGFTTLGTFLSGQPTYAKNVIAAAGNGQASIQWTRNHAGAPNTATVTASPGGAIATVAASGQAGAATVAGLTNGTAYTFTVVESNTLQASAVSQPSNSVTPTAFPASILPVTRGLEFMWSAGNVVSPPANAATLATMVDQSGNGYNAVGLNAGTWVTAWSGGKPALSLNGSNQGYNCLASGFAAGMRGINATMYVVYDVVANPNANATTGARVLSQERPSLIMGNTGGGFALGVGSAATQANPEIYNNSAQSSSATYTGATVAFSIPTYVTVTRPGAMRVNGVAVPGLIDGAANWGAANAPWCFGYMYGGGFNKQMQGRIAEIHIFSVVHTPAEIALMETYLAGRF